MHGGMACPRSKSLTRTAPAVLVALGLAGPLGLSALAPVEARATGPKIAAAFTIDRDGDGRVDGLDVRFDAPIRGTPKPGAFRVAGMRIVRATKARGRRVSLLVAEGTGCDAGGKPAVSFAGRGLKDRRGRAVRRSKVNMERRDRGAPRMVCAVYFR